MHFSLCFSTSNQFEPIYFKSENEKSSILLGKEPVKNLAFQKLTIATKKTIVKLLFRKLFVTH